MSKLKNIFKLSVLSVASLALLGSGAGLILSQQEQTNSVSYADTNATVNNTQHDFFIGKWMTKKSVDSDYEEKSKLTDTASPLVLANSGDYINVKFDTQRINEKVYKKGFGPSGTENTVGYEAVTKNESDSNYTLTKLYKSFTIKGNSKAIITYRLNGVEKNVTLDAMKVSETEPSTYKLTNNNTITLENDTTNTVGKLTFNFGEKDELIIDSILIDGTEIETYDGFVRYDMSDETKKIWDCFTFTNFSVKRNGTPLSFGTNGTPSYVKKQNAGTTYGSPIGRGTMDFDLDITFKETGVTTPTLSGNKLQLTEEGVYEISIPYTIYSTVDNGNSFPVSSSGTIVWTFMLFSHDTYLVNGLNTPNINIQNFGSIEKNDLFFNYQGEGVPYFDYDVTRYNLTITKSLNNEDSSVSLVYNHDENKTLDFKGDIQYTDGKIVYNDAFYNKYCDTGLFELSFDKESKTARVYLKDIGKYTLDFDLVYSYNTDNLNPTTYILPQDVDGKRAYLYGYQSTFTKYNTSASKNEYPEFKTYDSNFNIKESADITRFVDNAASLSSLSDLGTLKIKQENFKPVSTNQSPVKFKEYGTYNNAYLYKVTTSTSETGETTLTLGTGTQITSTKNVSLSGNETEQKYLAVFEYSFDDYIKSGLSAPSHKFYQAFYFELTNATPTVTVKAENHGDTTPELPSQDFTNQTVYVKNNYAASTFNSDPIIEIVRYDFMTRTYDAARDLSSYDEDSDYYKITENGRYTINIYSGRNGKAGTPITRQFTIDKTKIENVEAYGVSLKNSSEYIVTTSNLEGLTNQPLIFTWKDRKESGARTFGYYKYYSLEADTSTSYESALSAFLEYIDSMPISYKLNLNSTPSWIRYPNAEGYINSDAISPSFVKTGTGLYILYITDQAGNESVSVYLLDNTASPFAIKKVDQSGNTTYSYLNQNDNLSQDATIYWAGNKVYKADNHNAAIYKDVNATEDTDVNTKIQAAYDEFESKYIKNISLVPAGYQGRYVSVPFVKEGAYTKVLFKDLGSNSTNFVSFKDNRYDIISSFSLYTYVNTIGDTYYYLSSTSGVYYETNIADLSAYKNNEISSYELYVRALNNKLDSSNPNYDNIVTGLTDYAGEEFDPVYNREGSFDFMIRDIANTRGESLSESQRYLNYPTGYQVINLSSDKSELKVIYTDSNREVPLTMADYAAMEGKIDPKGQNVASNKQKTAYYQPTSINQKLYVSFVPRVINGDGLIQIDKINVKFYPFVKKFYSTQSPVTTLYYYRDLSSTPTIDMDIAFDETATTAQRYELNIVQDKTQEGKYVIKRTYKDGTVDGVNYTIDKYDYKTRTIEFIVDRENVISEPEVITATTTTYEYKNNDKKLKLFTVGKVLISNQELNNEPYRVESNGQSTVDLNPFEADKYYYVFDKIIENPTLFENGTEVSTTSSSSIEQSAQSIVGNGIMVSVFSDTLSSVEFPNLKLTEEGYAKYNSGYTFYTVAQSYSDILNTNLNSVFTTNKRPFRIYIPSYKYTTHNLMSDVTDTSKRSFESFNNDGLIKFNENNFIDYYKLSAEIYRGREKYAVSSGDENGFLKFNKVNGEPLTSFTEAGQYYVVITQALDSRATDVNSFKNNYTFTFTVNPGNPIFNLYDGKGYELDGPRDENNQLTDTLYTNQKTILARWTDDLSEFITNIDVKKIKVVLGGKEYLVEALKEGGINTVSNPSVDENPSVDDSKLDQIKNALSFTYNSTSLLNELKIDLEKAGCYKHGEEVSVTVEFENPTNVQGIYTPKTKKVILDTSIFDADGTTTLDRLFNNVKDFSSNISLDALRTYLDNSGNVTTDKSNTCYSQTAASDFYRYYSYLVDQSFFDELQASIENNKVSNENGKTSVYVRKLANIYNAEGNFEETNYDSFFPSSTAFTSIELMNFEKNYYYEIIESDYAGNLNIYLVYYFDNEDAALRYSVEDEYMTLSDEQISTDKYNIYATNDIAITEILFHGDKWNFIKVEQSGRTNLYVKTPWLSEGYIQNLTTGESVSLTTLLSDANSINKSIISISDRSNGEWKRVYVSKSNISSLNLENVSSDQEGIKIKLPAGDVLTTTSVVSYPVKIQLDITMSGSNNFYSYENNPILDIANSSLYQSNWASLSDPVLTFEYSNITNYLTVLFNTVPPVGTKVKYTVTDNFGNETSTIHIFGTDFTDSYEYTGYLYQAYDENGHLINYVQNSYTYQYNSGVYSIEVYLGDTKIEPANYSTNYISESAGFKYNSLKFEKSSAEQLDRCYEVKVYDADTKGYIKSVYINLYDVLPRISREGNTYDYVVNFLDQNGLTINDKFTGDFGSVTINGQSYNYEGAKTFATLVNVTFSPSPVKIPYGAYLYKEGDNDFSAIENGYQIRETGVYYILFKYNSENLFTHEYRMYKLEVLDSSTSFFYVTLDGKVINAQNAYFTNGTKQYSNYYLVNVAYAEKSRVNIETNIYQKVNVLSNVETIQRQGVTTVIYTLTNKTGTEYPVGVSPYYDQIAISYIPSTTTPSQRFSYVSPSGEEVSILNESSAIVTAEKGTSFDQLILKWSNYFGLTENKIYLKVEKDGREIETPVYYENENTICYTVFDTSGLYKISLWDYAGNRQKFGARDYFELIFLKDAHFTMTHVENGEEVKTEAIDRGVFNGTLKLTLENIRKFYLSSSVNRLTATRNGAEYTPVYDSTTSTYTFDEVGFYQVYFTATAANGIDVREQVYSFTIVNPNESRYAFSYSAYESYLITKVIKDDGVVEPVEKTDMENKDSLYVSYYDEATGLGVWTITVDTGKKLNIDSATNETTKFTFSFLIRSAVPPIEISVAEGSTSTKTITVSFNAENIYNAVGDCILKFGSYEFKINADTIANIDVQRIDINSAGTYFIQVTTESGNLLYSYMVVKKDPLNAWAIVAIVLGSVVAIAVVIIIIKLRKRIKVK